MEEEHQHDHQPAIEPPNAVLKIARIFLSNERDAFLAAELVGSVFPLGEGWTLVAAVKHGYNRLVLRVAQEPMVDCTARLLRLHDFNNALSMAVVLGDITLAKLLVTSMVNMRITTAIGVAARCGQLGFLQWVYTNYFDACWGGTEMTKAARFGHLDTLIWLQNETIRRGPQHLLGHAARHLSSDIVNWVVDRRREEPQLSDLIVAVEHGRLKNLEILVARMQPPLRIPALHAARNGHLHVIKWLEINYGEFTEQFMDAAAQNGHLDILYHLRQHRTEGCSMRAIVLAATNGHLSTVQWIVGNYPDKVSPDALRAAISSGRTKVAQWLHSEVNIAWRGNLVECAARHGSRELVAWTLVAFPHQWTPAAMDNAALAGNAELFFMFHNARKTCMSNAVDDFAAHGNLVMRVAPLTQWTTPQPMGHLDVVKHLHGIGAPCTFRAIDDAATNDHVEVLNWFHLNRPEGCSFNAMDNAAERGNMKSVKWLHEHGADCTERAMDAAARQGHLEIVVYLHRERDEGCSRRASLWAAEGGQLEILLWLRLHYPSKFDVNAVIRAAPTHSWNCQLLQHLCRF